MKANIKFVEIEPYLVKSLPGPLEVSSRNILHDNWWSFINKGDHTEDVNWDIYEIDSYGYTIKTLASYSSPNIDPCIVYHVIGGNENTNDFSRRYEIGEYLHLAMVIWGVETENKPAPPYTAARISGSDYIVWDVYISAT